jgi:hypothetical protein
MRRDDPEPTERRPSVKAGSGCAIPAGESPVRVSAGAPGSRPPPGVERPTGEARCRKSEATKVVDGEQVRGPQHQVKPAASSHSQSGSRAAHVTAKATPTTRDTGRVEGPGGVWGAARGQGVTRNTRGPSAPRWKSSHRRLYKPMAKSGAAQRESEGAVVPLTGARRGALMILHIGGSMSDPSDL